MAKIDPLLIHLQKFDGSDLHLVAGQPPRFRAKGSIEIIEGQPVLSDADLRDIMREVASNFLEYSQGILGDTISRIPQVMLGLDAFPDRIPYAWGGTFLLAFNPVLRLVGLSEYQGDNLGTTFFQLARPELPSWLETGYHTSLAGEFLANFPWFVTPLAFILFGLLLRVLYVRLIRQGNTLISVCAYAIMLFPILSMLITEVSLVLFELAVVVVPVLLARPLWRSSRAPSRTFDEGANSPEREGGGDSGWWT